jgi:CubicO group peptidase (beta-lactamase class C family)
MGDTGVDGTVDARFDAVRDVFAGVVSALPGTGAAVAARTDGRWVVDLWGGYADQSRQRPWRADSIVQPYSVTKPFVALCALLLVDRGSLELDAPMQRYWPEFRAQASVRHVLSHQAGVVAIDTPVSTETFYDWDRMCELLAEQEPAWTPGTAHGESPLLYGHLVGELVRRIDGRSLGRFLRDEVCTRLGLDFAIGLTPAEHDRAVDLTGLDEQFRRQNAAGRPPFYQRAIANPPGAQDAAVVNSRVWRSAEIPAVNGHGTARAIAGLYATLLEGGLLYSTLLNEATTAQCSGRDLVFGHDNAWGLGFAVDADGFGMGGLGGSYGGASRIGGYAFSFVTGSMGDGTPAIAVENSLRECLVLPALS